MLCIRVFAVLLLYWLAINTLLLSIGVVSGITGRESTCAYEQGLRRIEYVFPAHAVGCWAAKRPGARTNEHR